MEPPLILALDIGTSSVRAALYDGTGEMVRRTLVKVDWSFRTTPDGGFELDAERAYKQVVAAIDAVLKKAERVKGDIECVATCAFWHSLVGVDGEGRPTTPVFGWADTRSREYSAALRGRLDESSVHNRTGARFHSSYWPAKLLWLQVEFSALWRSTAKWLSFSDHVAFRLSGEATTSVSMASGTGIFDQRALDWDDEPLRSLRVGRGRLPLITDEPYELNTRFSKRWPRLKSARWLAGVGDGAADHVGACGIGEHRASLMVGTSGAMRVAYKGKPPKRIPDGLWCYRIDRTRVIVGGALSDGGNLYRWLKDDLKVPKNAEEEMRRRGAAAHGLIVLPFFHGERSTGYNEDAIGVITGLTPAHDSIDILQAAMESVAYRFAEIYDQLNTVVKVKDILASGGALRDSPVWTQIVADVLGRDLVVNDAAESSLRGAVLLALRRLGKIDGIESLMAPDAVTLAHHPKCHAAYRLGRKQHQNLYLKTHK